MKILHTADWHLGKKLYSVSRLEEQRAVLEEINQIADREEADVVLVAGDLYDVINPSNDAIELLYKSLRQLSNDGKRPVIAIAGNHDSPDRIEAPDPLARECGIIMIGYPNSKVRPFSLLGKFEVTQSANGFLELKLEHHKTPLRIITTPYASEIRLKEDLGDDDAETMRAILQKQWKNLADTYCDNKGINLLTAHLFVNGKDEFPQEEPEGEKPIKVGNASIIYPELFPSQVQYVALGHLHRSHFVTGGTTSVAYSGSPLSYSFSEAGHQKKVHLVKLEAGKKPETERLNLSSGRPLKRAVFKTVEEAVAWLKENEEAFTEITMRTKTFLETDDLRALRQASPHLINIIPEPEEDGQHQRRGDDIDLTKDVRHLFSDFFIKQQGQEPNDEIKDLFNEILSIKEQN